MALKRIHTPGPWRIGKNFGAVVAPTGKGITIGGAADIEHYGGFLVGESISDCNRPIVSQAPALAQSVIELLSLVTLIEKENGWDLDPKVIARANKALKRSRITWEDDEQPDAGSELATDLANAIIDGAKQRARHHWFYARNHHAESPFIPKPRYDTWQEAVENWLDETTPAEQSALLSAGFIQQLKP